MTYDIRRKCVGKRPKQKENFSVIKILNAISNKYITGQRKLKIITVMLISI